MVRIVYPPEWEDKDDYIEPKDDQNVRVPRLEVDDDTTYIDKDGSDNITLTDAVTGTKTLAQLVAGAAGDVAGPASSTDNAIARFHSTTGKVIQDYTSNPPTISDSGDVTIDGDVTADNFITAGNVDGRDVSTDGTKLDGIATNATKYPDTGEEAFLDADHSKLDNIAANADVTGSNTCDTPGGAGTDTTAIHYGTAVELGYTLDSEMSGDHKYSGITVSGTAGYGTTAIGQLVYLASADKKWELADADAEATTKPQLGIALAAVAEDAALLVLLLGYVRDDGFSLTNDGAPLFVGLTAGAMVEDVSGYTTGDCVRIVGHIHDASANTIFFNPDGTWVEIA